MYLRKDSAGAGSMLLGGLLCSRRASHGHEEESDWLIDTEMGRVHTVLPTFPYIPLSG